MIDISDKSILENYLSDRGLINKLEDYKIKYLSGGVSGVTALVVTRERNMIIKQALAKLLVAEEWLCDPSRMEIEALSNEIYHRLVPENAPAVYFYDNENYIFGREAAPEHCVMWKTDLMSGKLDFEVAHKVIESLMIVHNECAKDAKVAKDFDDNAIFYDLRISPYLEFILLKHPNLTEYSKPIIHELMNSKITLVHGDFSPKNVVLDGRKVFLTDFEVAHYGHPSFDLGFLSNHLVLKAIHMEKFGKAYLAMLEYVLDVYFTGANYMDNAALEKSFLKLLPLLMIARVDGKSPVEYIVRDDVKQFVRDCAYAIMDNNVSTRKELLALLTKKLEERKG
ncbi:MAG: phosphotransferase [Defluviitaleaceae bacterium]|nr:phosphotransferase [Defluviitaleaceae bacterium]